MEGYVITSPVYVNIYQKGADVRMYFSAVLNKKPVQVGTFVKDVVNPGKHQEKGPGAGLYMTSLQKNKRLWKSKWAYPILP